jgi:hypothetical protein
MSSLASDEARERDETEKLGVQQILEAAAKKASALIRTDSYPNANSVALRNLTSYTAAI